ncbi:hypothetical protein ACQP2U_21960 [Nocardia sp. CA-084685]|uniref:hypothetical protein n=1 Tax=Nocardia sp. CA-084685 TaxID=3239970 RepID=UPI003D9A0952
MTTSRNCLRTLRIATVFAPTAAVLVATAAPALAAATIDISRAGPTIVQVTYSCDDSDGVASIQAMMGEPTADGPAAQGAQNAVTCDNTQHDASIPMTETPGRPPMQSDRIQVRVALVDRNDTVVSGQAKLFTVQ